MTGYLNPLYASALSEFGRPRELRHSGGWLLERQIPTTSLQDAIGCYPIFCCADWTKLKEDFADLKRDLVTIAVATDPFADTSRELLLESFDVVKPFKEHYVIEATQPVEEHVTKHHRYYARKALRSVCVERVEEPAQYLDDWIELYGVLTIRHGLTGLQAFSPQSFSIQFKVPGLVMFRATIDNRTVGIHLWYLQSGVAYSHLAASSEEGYRLGVSYALYWSALHGFREQDSAHLKWIDLGAAAGASDGNERGLSQFKSGWATMTKTKYFCGRICDSAIYKNLTQGNGQECADFFPAYRTGI